MRTKHRAGDGTRRHQKHMLMLALFSSLLLGCSAFAPLPPKTSLGDRLASIPREHLPIDQPVHIHWNAHHIPYIVAQSDNDAAFALGIVHAHLRLGQMAAYRQISQGRLAEMAGPIAADIDHALRLLDFGRASQAAAAFPEETREWLQRFVDGINYYQATSRVLPHEYRVLGLDREPWTIEDILTFGRLAGTDVSWLVWFNLLPLRERQDWPQIWARLVNGGGEAAKGQVEPGSAAVLGHILRSTGRPGSNSTAIAPTRTQKGGAILANDPHVGLNLPNTWLIVGLRSPSYQVVGLMIPGIPLFAIGRNPSIAWGGTNMRASASDLIDVSASAAADLQSRTETIAIRWWPDRTIRRRDSEWGPVISDAPQLAQRGLPDTALRWTGHEPSDEISAMLGVARASDFTEFRGALAGFGVPGQNMLYADRAGNIGRVFAVHVPDRAGAPPDDMILQPAAAARVWSSQRTAAELPVVFNPDAGFIASANNRPTEPNAHVGYFFSPSDRVDRLAELIQETSPLDVASVMGIQQDVYAASSVSLRDLFVRRLDETGLSARANAREEELIDLMRRWDGHYRVESRGALALELFRHALTRRFYAQVFGSSDWSAFASVGNGKTLLLEDIEAADSASLAPLLQESLEEAAGDLAKFANWGDMHRLALRHPLAFLPVVGARFRFADHPIGGSSETIMKTAHRTTRERHTASYGANARHISDLSDPDANYFVLLGGQDGWLNSSTFLDQVPLWLRGGYVRMPLRAETVAELFPIETVLTP